jgi:hypothetical protein
VPIGRHRNCRSAGTAVAYRLGDQFSEDAISLVCVDCRYVHTFMPGAVQVWEEQSGYPEQPDEP